MCVFVIHSKKTPVPQLWTHSFIRTEPQDFVQLKIKLASDFDQNLSLFHAPISSMYSLTMPQFERNSTGSTIERKIHRIVVLHKLQDDLCQ